MRQARALRTLIPETYVASVIPGVKEKTGQTQSLGSLLVYKDFQFICSCEMVRIL